MLLGQVKTVLKEVSGHRPLKMAHSLFFYVITCLLISHSSQQDATEKKIGKIKPPVAKTPNTIINDVSGEELVHIVDEHEHVAILFYGNLDKKTQKVLGEMEEMETEDLDVEIVR